MKQCHNSANEKPPYFELPFYPDLTFVYNSLPNLPLSYIRAVLSFILRVYLRLSCILFVLAWNSLFLNKPLFSKITGRLILKANIGQTHLLEVWILILPYNDFVPWASYLASLCLCFLICKMIILHRLVSSYKSVWLIVNGLCVTKIFLKIWWWQNWWTPLAGSMNAGYKGEKD